MRQFLRQGSLVFAGLLLANGLTYVFYALAARALGVQTAGLFSSLVAAILVLAVPSSVVATVVAKVVADACARGEPGAVRAIGRRTAASLGPVLGLALAGATLGNAPLRSFFHTSDTVVISLALAGFAVTFPLAPQRAVLQGAGRYGAYALSSAVDALGKGLTGAALFLAPPGAGRLRLALGGFVFSTAFAYLVNVVLTARGSDTSKPAKLSRAALLRLVFGVAMPIAAVTAMTFADAVLVRHYLPPREAGFYNSAIALVGRAIVTVVQFVPIILLPRAAADAAAGRSPARFLGVACGLTVLTCCAVLLGVAFFPHLIVIAISGPSFAPAAPLLFPYGVAMSFLAFASVLSSYLIGVGRVSFAVPLTAVAVAEIGAIVIVHTDIATVVRIVTIGHGMAFACCVVATLASLRPRAGIAALKAEVAES